MFKYLNNKLIIKYKDINYNYTNISTLKKNYVKRRSNRILTSHAPFRRER